MLLHVRFKEKNCWFATLVITLFLGINTSVLAWAVAPVGQTVITPFDYNGVSLDSGRLKTQFDSIKEEYLRISNDDLLKGFRARRGFLAPGNDLGGWYSSDSFHIFGQIIGGLSRMYAADGDKACLDKVNYLISEWAKCIEPNGYFYYSRKPNAPHYIYEKMVGGLVDAYHYCGNKQALECLSKITDWAIKNLDRTRVYAFNNWSGNTEWYTLSENLYRAYLVTGDVKYKDFGRVWEYTEYWDIYAKNGDIFTRWNNYHAYSHINAINGAAPAYFVYGQQHYLDTLVNAFDYLKTHQEYATGGFGPNERLQADYQGLLNSLTTTIAHFETQCGSWAGFKMSKYLIGFTGDARFGDWVELLTYNGIGASIPASPAGAVQYWSNYNLYGGKKVNGIPWSCCAGSRPEAAADYYDLVWFKDVSSLYVNLYTPSTVHWNCKGTPVTVSQNGVLEEGKGIEFTVSAKSEVPFELKFRVPGWLAGPMTVMVNGKEYAAKTDSKHWLAVDRTWKDGDKVVVMLPMNLYTKRLDPGKVYPSAIMYGPIVLVGAISSKQEASRLDMNDVNSKLQPASTGVATFCLKSDKSVVFRPFYTFGRGEEYFMYIDPHMTDLEKIKYTGQWTERNNLHLSKELGAIAECRFSGTGVVWQMEKSPNAGKAEVSIDGKMIAIVDQYSPQRKNGFEWRYNDLTAGKHVIRIRVLNEKNENSKDTMISIVGISPLWK